MGAGGASVHGSNEIFDRKLDSRGKPNSRSDRYRNGVKVQSRWYDSKGKAVRNRDYKHGGNVKFPHDHLWTWNGDEGARGEEHLSPDFINYKD